MPITNTYRKYEGDGLFGVVANDSVPIKYIKDSDGKPGRFCATGTNASVSVWNLRTANPFLYFYNETAQRAVSTLAINYESGTTTGFLGIGYMDGWVSVFSINTGQEEISFRAGSHRVNSIDIFNSTVACAAESELHVVDIVSGSGFRLKGHRGAVTSVKIIPYKDILISSGRDTFIKFWCLRTQHCFLTLTGHPGPVWDFSLSADCKTLITGSSDTNLRLWKIKYNVKQDGQVESDLLNRPNVQQLFTGNLVESVPLNDFNSLLEIEFRGTIARKSQKRVFSLAFDASGRFLVCQTLDKILEIYVLLSEAEKQSRLRKKVKKAKRTGSMDPSEVELKAEDEFRCIYQITLPTKLSSCDIRVSHFNTRKPKNEISKEIEENERFSILHLLCSYRNNLVEEYSLRVPQTLPTRPVVVNAGRIARHQEEVDADQKFTEAKTNCGPELRLTSRIANPGHRSFPLGCQITEDGCGVFTLAHGEGKLWNRSKQSCLATIDWSSIKTEESAQDTDHSEETRRPGPSKLNLKASAFVLAPGSRRVVIGFESGLICLFDLVLKKCTQVISDAHSGAVKSIILTGDKKGIISGGSDSKVGFWDFDLRMDAKGAPNLCLKPHRPLQSVASQVTSLAATPDNRLIAVGMLNFHVDIYYTDTFKRVHSLYGMSSPVTCMDISHDSRLLITGDGDKTVRLWELQFGNCLRRFTQHTDPVMAVKFMHSSTLAFSADLGGIIREWDIKKMHEITIIKGHEGAITGLATLATRPGLGKQMQSSQKGKRRPPPPKRRRVPDYEEEEDDLDEEDEDDDFEADVCGGVLVSTGRDFSCRVWKESEDLVVMEEEAEIARETAEIEAELGRSEAVVPGGVAPEAAESGPLGRPTVTTRDAADSLMEAIDIYTHQTSIPPGSEPPHPLMAYYGAPNDPDRFLFAVFTSLRLPKSGGMSGLEHALGSVHTDHVTRLLPRLAVWMERGWDVELCGRALRYLTTLHAGMVTADTNLTGSLAKAVQARREHLADTRE
ncbi:unnamed protein product [Rodentolepis nana]|uniref:WD_REPEATS_REGION domain-containing protein n=1 Tax=Rodentolepis nana TaxID=102285 RepID=A0A0R3T6B7_RODNA|nr:unnamed protein product [Rodentolepis nana]